jgi:hypothetical protein
MGAKDVVGRWRMLNGALTHVIVAGGHHSAQSIATITQNPPRSHRLAGQYAVSRLGVSSRATAA